MNLPARVRIARLPGPPSEPLLTQMRRLDAEAPLHRLRELPTPDLTCLAVIAGGKLVGFLLAQRGESGWQERLALDANWRGRGIEAALREALGAE